MYLRIMRAGQRVLFVQTAFIGDAILATSMVETWHAARPQDEIHLCVRKGNDSLFAQHPFVKRTWVWDKSGGSLKRYARLIGLSAALRSMRFGAVFTPHRHASSGWLAGLSGAGVRSAFAVHPLARVFTHLHAHRFGDGTHEVERNHDLIREWANGLMAPRLYPSQSDARRWDALSNGSIGSWVIMTPMSQWQTKQWPLAHWEGLIQTQLEGDSELNMCLMGSPSDAPFLTELARAVNSDRVHVAAGWKLLEVAYAMSQVKAVVTNDSGPLHIASAMNAPTVAVFCSTSPSFGFGPLSAHHEVVEIQEKLACRPCGMHGHRRCPESHFRCGFDVNVDQVYQAMHRVIAAASR